MRKTKVVNCKCDGVDITNADIRGCRWDGLYYFKFEKHEAFYLGDKLFIGCKSYELDEWLRDHKDIARANKFNRHQLEAYIYLSRFCFKIKQWTGKHSGKWHSNTQGKKETK